MITRTITVQTRDDATEEDYCETTAKAIKGFLVGCSDELITLILTKLVESLPPESRKRVLQGIPCEHAYQRGNCPICNGRAGAT